MNVRCSKFVLAWRFFDYFVCFIRSIWIGILFPKICWINLKIVEDFKKFSKSKVKITKVVFQSKDMDYNLQILPLDFGFGLDCNCLSFFMYWISIWRLMYSAIEIMINLFSVVMNLLFYWKHSISFGEEIFFSEFWYPVWIVVVVVVVVCRHRRVGHDFCKRESMAGRFAYNTDRLSSEMSIKAQEEPILSITPRVSGIADISQRASLTNCHWRCRSRLERTHPLDHSSGPRACSTKPVHYP